MDASSQPTSPNLLTRTPSADDARQVPQSSPASARSAHTLSNATSANRKAPSADPGTNSRNVHRSSVSLPPANQSSMKSRFPSVPASPNHIGAVAADPQISDSLSSSPPPAPRTVLHRRVTTESIPEGDEDRTPTLEPSDKMAPTLPFMLPDPAMRAPNSRDGEVESTRLSFSSLYSFGSAIVNSTRGLVASSPPSVTDSETDCKFTLSLHTSFPHLNAMVWCKYLYVFA